MTNSITASLMRSSWRSMRFVDRQFALTGIVRMNDDTLDGLVVAQDALLDIVAGRMRPF